VIDWLDRYGSARSLIPKGTDLPRNDFGSFVMKCGTRFETWMVEKLIQPRMHSHHPNGFADLSRYTRFQQNQHLEATLEALEDKQTLMLYQPFVVDDKRGWFGHPDLVIRRDALPLFEAIITGQSGVDVSTLNPCEPLSTHPGWAIIDIKYSSTLVNKPLYQAQLLIYMMALNSMTDKTESNADPVCVDDLYLVGRTGEMTRAFTRNNQVGLVESSIQDARDWIRMLEMNNECADWKISPVPSVRELMVSPTRDETNFKWDEVLNRISREQGDVCAVYKVGPVGRNKLAFPPLPWWNPLCTAKYLNIREADQSWVDNMLVSARKVRLSEPVEPVKKLTWVEALGSTGSVSRAIQYKLIAFDFEFVYDLHLVESFKEQTQSWAFSVSSGVIRTDANVDSNTLSLSQSCLTDEFSDCVRTETGELTDQGELQMIERWLTWLKLQQQNNCTIYGVHWSQAEPQCLKRIRNKVKPGSTVSDLFLWWDRCVVMIDLMSILVTRKVIIPGALEYGLKPVYANLFRHPIRSQSSSSSSTSMSKKRKAKQPENATTTTPLITEPPLDADNGLNHTGLAGDSAALIAYDLAQQNRFVMQPDEAMQRIMDYNADDVRMTASVWLSVMRMD